MIIHSHDARTVVAICGFGSVAMLDYLERSGVFIPSIKRPKTRGKWRRYTFRDVLVLKTIKTLLDNGASVANLKASLEKFQRVKWKADEVVLETGSGPLKYLVASAGKIYFARNSEALTELTANGQMVFSFVIDVERLHTELCASWRQSRLDLTG